MLKKAESTGSRAAQARRPNLSPKRKYIEVMDTTLRDGEQTGGVSISPAEKLLIAQRLLERVQVDRIEIASCRVSEGERKAVGDIMKWAESEGWGGRVEVLSFCDYNKSVDWMLSVGCRRMNLLTKGSLKHCQEQLRKTPEQHLEDIRRTLGYAISKGVQTSIYMEDWSNGMLHSPDYVHFLLKHFIEMPFERILLPDTLGVLSPWQVHEFVSELVAKYGAKKEFEFHGHNDYGLATGNSLAAALAGCAGIHCTVNGLGERAGNSPLDEFVAALHDHSDLRTRVKEKELFAVSRLVESFTGRRVSSNKPIVGSNVFTQTAGIHADGDKKGELYVSELTPERFGRTRSYALGKLAGRASLDFNLQKMKRTLTPEQHKAVLDRVIALGDAKKTVTAEDLPFIISDVLETPELRAFEVKQCLIASNKGLKPIASIVVRFKESAYEAQGVGNGGYDAFMNALRSIDMGLSFEIPPLTDYEVRIPPGGKTDALVETSITWANGIQTRGVNTDQVMAAIEATERLINMMALSAPAQKRGGKKKAVKK